MFNKKDKKGSLKNFAKFSGKNQWWSLFLNKKEKPASLKACNFIKQDTRHGFFPKNFANFLTAPIS